MNRSPVRRFGAAALAIVSISLLAAVSTPGAAGSKPAGTPPKVTAVTLGIRHRVFHGFAEKQTVEMKKRFQIGDTDYSGELIEFQPDFVIELKPRRITSRSNEPKNPAVRIVVRENGAPQDTVWAFLNMAPHFGVRSMLAFQILEMQFEGHDPVMADTSVAVPDTSGGHGR